MLSGDIHFTGSRAYTEKSLITNIPSLTTEQSMKAHSTNHMSWWIQSMTGIEMIYNQNMHLETSIIQFCFS